MKRIAFSFLIPLGVGVAVLVTLMIIHGQSITNATDSVTVNGSKAASATSTATTAATAAAAAPSAFISELQTAWSSLASTRAGDVDIAVYNNKTGETAHYTNSAGTLNTASIVKLAIAEAVLLQSQTTSTPLTTTQTSNLKAMLENSDNTAATTLWNQVGSDTAMNAFFKKIGATSTTAATGGLWGLTQTNATDQLKVLNVLAYPGTYLTTASAATINAMLDDVESDQTWGVSAGLVGDADFKLKNGWLEDNQTKDAYAATTSWTVNSVGHITADGVDYTIAVLTMGQTTEEYGIETIEELSTKTWEVLNEQ